MPPYSRGQAAYEAGDRLVNLATRMLTSGPSEMVRVQMELSSIRMELDRAIRSCRAARGMYHTNPRARTGIIKAGERLAAYRDEFASVVDTLSPDTWRACAGALALLGNNIKFLDWHQEEDPAETTAAGRIPSGINASAEPRVASYDPLEAAMQEPADD